MLILFRNTIYFNISKSKCIYSVLDLISSISQISFFSTSSRTCIYPKLYCSRNLNESNNYKFLSSFTGDSTDSANLKLSILSENPQLDLREINFSSLEHKNKLKSTPNQPQSPEKLKVCLVGAPNAGKSTLANKLVGWRFSSVSKKVHTTRQKSLGILTEKNKQIIFLDTPGMITPSQRKKFNLELSLLIDPHESLYQASIFLVIVDVSTIWGKIRLDEEVLKVLHLYPLKHSILILNKVDLVKNKQSLLTTVRNLTEGMIDHKPSDPNPKIKKHSDCQQNKSVDEEIDLNTPELFTDLAVKLENGESRHKYLLALKKIKNVIRDKKGWPGFKEVFMISATTGDGVKDLKDYLLNATEPGPWEYHPSVITNDDPYNIAKMCVTEKLLDNLTGEIPYAVKVELHSWDCNEDNHLRICFELFCSTRRHLLHVLGKDGKTIELIAHQAKAELMNTFRRELSLKLIARLVV